VPPVKYPSISPLMSAVFIATRSSVSSLAPARIVSAVDLNICLLGGQRLERVQSPRHRDVDDVPVVVGEQAVAALFIAGSRKSLPALVLGHLAADDVGIDHEGEGPVALGHADQLAVSAKASG
jgi:hypothetical protein